MKWTLELPYKFTATQELTADYVEFDLGLIEPFPMFGREIIDRLLTSLRHSPESERLFSPRFWKAYVSKHDIQRAEGLGVRFA